MTSPSAMLRPVIIAGTGSYLPDRIVTNHDLEKFVDTSDEWILTRTGMKERRFAAEDQATSDLGAQAALRALADACVAPEDVDLIIVATITPDMPWPNTACLIQHKIGATRAACFSLEAACSGSLYALDIARLHISTGSADTVLVIGAEKMSSILDWEDRTTCVLFGDGAGAVVLCAGDQPGHRCSVLGSDGSLAHLLQVPGGGSRHPTSAETVANRMHYLKMGGRDVFKHAVTNMTSAAQEALRRCDMKAADLACIVPHQANIRIIQAIAQRVELPMDRFFINLDKYGNTSGASILIALDEAVKTGRIADQDRIMFLVFGGGFTWGAMIWEWKS